MATEERMDPLKTKKLRSLLWHVERYVWAARIAQGRTIDAACGMGYGTILLAGNSEVKSVLGIDISPKVIEACRRRYAHHSSRVEFEVMDVRKIPGGQTIVSFETIEHIEDPERFLARVHQVLDSSGRFLASVPVDERKDQNPYHLHHYTAKEFFKLLDRAGFVVLESWTQEEPGSKEVTRIKVVEAVKK